MIIVGGLGSWGVDETGGEKQHLRILGGVFWPSDFVTTKIWVERICKLDHIVREEVQITLDIWEEVIAVNLHIYSVADSSDELQKLAHRSNRGQQFHVLAHCAL